MNPQSQTLPTMKTTTIIAALVAVAAFTNCTYVEPVDATRTSATTTTTTTDHATGEQVTTEETTTTYR